MKRVLTLTALAAPLTFTALLLLGLGLAWLSTPAFAGGAKVDVCHFPPDDPDGYRTIRISENALPAHMAHGDLTGSCNALCAQICDDDSACTVDDTDDCEQNGCPDVREPVDCNDGLSCTTDTCDAKTGCQNTPIECTPSDPCHVSMCADPEGECLETPVVCSDGESCNPSTGECEPTACFTSSDWASSSDFRAAISDCIAVAGCPSSSSHLDLSQCEISFMRSNCDYCIRYGGSFCSSCDATLATLDGCSNVCGQ